MQKLCNTTLGSEEPHFLPVLGHIGSYIA